MNTTKRTPIFTALVVTLMALTSACTAESEETLRMLPIAAIDDYGTEVLVGTYDEATSDFVLVPEFVARAELVADGRELLILGPTHSQAMVPRGSWDTTLDEGDTLTLVLPATQLQLGELVLHAPEWTDGLTELEARSAYGTCYGTTSQTSSSDPDD